MCVLTFGAEVWIHDFVYNLCELTTLPPFLLISLQDSSLVGQTFCPFPTGPAVGGDGGAVDPPNQGAKWMDMCVEAWIALGINST